jgi:hypothetical protein
MSYTKQQFEQDVILFNQCCGSVLPTEDMTTDEIKAIIQRQVKIVNEELLETITALSEGNLVELLDGIADVRYTLVWLTKISEVADKLPNAPIMDHSLNGWLEVMRVTVAECCDVFPEDIILEASRRVAENNNSKFTTDCDVAQQWADGVDFMVKIEEAVVDGVSYFCLRDNNGKIRKKADFVSVELGDLL